MQKNAIQTADAERKETKVSSSYLLFLACWLVYTCAYIARGNFSFARSLMMEEGLIGVGVAGAVSSVYFICYAVGQMVNGALADKKSPFGMVAIGLALVVASNLAMTLAQPSWLFCVWWAVNGFGQSMLWSPVFFIISNILHSKVRFFAVTAIALSTPAGKMSCSLLSSLALKGGKWANVFYMASFIIAAMLLLWIAAYLAVRKNVINNAVVKENKANDEEKAEKGSHSALALFLGGGLIALIPSLLVYGVLCNGVSEVVPSILSGEYGLSASAAALLDTVIPIIGIVGVFFSNFCYLKMFKRNEVSAAFFCMMMCVPPVLVMLAMALLSKDGFVFGQYADAAIFVVAYALIYLLQLAFAHLIISLMAMKFSRFSLAATASGLTNAAAYGGSAIATYGLSYAIELLPLWGTLLIWLGCLAVAAVSLFFGLKQWKRFSKENKLI
ncbi:MAG: MFS transporter [Ruminococcaceae bacterium]|nr:MFS transporter [Oscillospiraceae bacterium]